MKKLLLLLFVFSISTAFATGIKDDETNEIVDLETKTVQNDRSIINVLCSINRDRQTVNVDYSGIGIPIVTITDSCGNIYYRQQAYMYTGNLTLCLPEEEGIYQILVQSNLYTGVGYFLVY